MMARSCSTRSAGSTSVTARRLATPSDSPLPGDIPTRVPPARSMVGVGRSAYRDGVLGSLFTPWRRRSTWWDLGHSVLSLPLGIVFFASATALSAASIGLLITFPLAIPVLWLLFLGARGVGRLERSRLDVLLGVRLADPV